MRRGVVLVLLVLVATEGALAARLFNSQGHHMKREVGRRKRDQDGRMRYKEVDSEHFGHAAFDPHYGLEDELEAEDLGYEPQDIHDASPGIIENRLKALFPLIDTNHDGVISSDELTAHLYSNGMAISRRRAEAEFNDTDSNHDDKVSPQEYLSTLLEDGDTRARELLESGAFPDTIDYSSYVEVTRAAMMLSDLDHDGGLDHQEFYGFLNPEEGNNINLKLHRLRQDIYEHVSAGIPSRHDDHGDGSAHSEDRHQQPRELTFDQFYEHFWGQFTIWDGHNQQYDETREQDSARRKFVLLDLNADNKLTAEEMLPTFADIHPTESRYARMQAEHMMDMAECKDDRLTLQQMLEVPHAFYGVVHDHDEL